MPSYFINTEDGKFEITPTNDGVYLYHQTETETKVIRIPIEHANMVASLMLMGAHKAKDMVTT
jgi:hypothetical protein